VVAPDAGGPREIVDPASGLLYTPGDARAGADALVAVLSDPRRAAAMGAAGRERARTHFDRERTRAGFRTALAPLLTDSGRVVDSGRVAGAGAELAVVTVTHNSASELPTLLAS